MVNQAFWQFHCPECGFGDVEHGHLLTAHEIHCIVCLEEDGRQIRLRRWEVLEVEQRAAWCPESEVRCSGERQSSGH